MRALRSPWGRSVTGVSRPPTQEPGRRVVQGPGDSKYRRKRARCEHVTLGPSPGNPRGGRRLGAQRGSWDISWGEKRFPLSGILREWWGFSGQGGGVCGHIPSCMRTQAPLEARRENFALEHAGTRPRPWVTPAADACPGEESRGWVTGEAPLCKGGGPWEAE